MSELLMAGMCTKCARNSRGINHSYRYFSYDLSCGSVDPDVKVCRDRVTVVQVLKMEAEERERIAQEAKRKINSPFVALAGFIVKS